MRIRGRPREPVTDPTLGIEVPRAEPRRPAKHRLVTIGDSLTEGFMSAAVYRTDLSWPAIAAYELGLGAEEFRFPTYEWPAGPGGLPLDLERFARAFEKRFGDRLDFWEIVAAGLWTRNYMDRVEDYWERGRRCRHPAGGQPVPQHGGVRLGRPRPAGAHRLDRRRPARRPARDQVLSQLVEHHQDRAARPVLQRARRATGPDRAGRRDRDEQRSAGASRRWSSSWGPTTRSVPSSTSTRSGHPEGYADLPPDERLAAKRGCTVFRPSAFAADWGLLVRRLRGIEAQHVLIGTVPAVTIAPIARGTYKKIRPQSRYFPYYTRPWITDDDFQPERDPHLTGDEARAIDSAIDAYNETIIDSVAAARRDGLDWYLFDLGALLDRLAIRRYIESPWARPSWWTPYELPEQLRALDPVPNTRFFRAGRQGRTDGGLFSLDGVHPTTIAYGVLAQEVMKVMELAGVTVPRPDGKPERTQPSSTSTGCWRPTRSSATHRPR